MCVSHTWLHRGDHVDLVVEEDINPQIEFLKNHLSVVNDELNVSRIDGDVLHIFLVKL